MQATSLISLFAFALAVMANHPAPPTGNARSIPQQSSQQGDDKKVHNYQNPIVQVQGDSIKAGEKVPINWSDQGDYGYVNIDLVNSCGYMAGPMHVATVPANQGTYTWDVPDYIKHGGCYKVIVWGVEQPQPGDTRGQSTPLTVSNDIPNAPQTLVVNCPGKVELGNDAVIEWNYSPIAPHPAYVDINCVNAQGQVVKKLATVSCSDKRYVWHVPENDDVLCHGGPYYLQVNGGPLFNGKESNDYGANSQPVVFVPAGTLVNEEDDLVVKDVTETVDSGATAEASSSSAVGSVTMLSAMAIIAILGATFMIL